MLKVALIAAALLVSTAALLITASVIAALRRGCVASLGWATVAAAVAR